MAKGNSKSKREGLTRRPEVASELKALFVENSVAIIEKFKRKLRALKREMSGAARFISESHFPKFDDVLAYWHREAFYFVCTYQTGNQQRPIRKHFVCRFGHEGDGKFDFAQHTSGGWEICGEGLSLQECIVCAKRSLWG